MRRFTILRSRLVSRINELPPTSPPLSATYPFGFLSPASSSPEVHPAVGVMRMLASSSNVSAAHPHCFSTLGVSKLKPSPRIESFAFSAIGSEPSALLRLPVSRASALRWRSASVSFLVRFPLPVLMPPSVSCSPSRFAPLIGSLEVPTLSLRSLHVVSSRTSVPEMIQAPQHPGSS